MVAVLDEAPPAAWPFDYEVVPVERCFVDPAYQRPLTSLAKEIAADFRPYLIGTVILSKRSRQKPDLALIDGQNRWVGAQGAGEENLPAVVYTGLSRAQEAQIFSDLQVRRRNLSSYQRFRASLVGKDPQSLAIVGIAKHAGYELGVDQQADTLRAVGALEWGYRGGRPKNKPGLPEGPEYLRRTMHALKAAWPDYSQPNGDIIKGAVLFFMNAEGQVEDDRFERSLRGTSPTDILFRAQNLRAGRAGGGMGASYVADVLSGNYAKTRR